MGRPSFRAATTATMPTQLRYNLWSAPSSRSWAILLGICCFAPQLFDRRSRPGGRRLTENPLTTIGYDLLEERPLFGLVFYGHNTFSVNSWLVLHPPIG